MLDVTYSSLLKPLRGILSSEQQEESNNTKHCSRLNLRNLWSCQRLFISPEYRTRCNKAHHPLPGEWVFLEATQRHGDGTSVRGEDAILSITRCVSVTFNLAQELLTFPWSTRWGIWYLRFRRAIPPIERIVPAEWAGTMNRVNHFRVFNYSVHVSPNRPTVYSDRSFFTTVYPRIYAIAVINWSARVTRIIARFYVRLENEKGCRRRIMLVWNMVACPGLHFTPSLFHSKEWR